MLKLILYLALKKYKIGKQMIVHVDCGKLIDNIMTSSDRKWIASIMLSTYDEFQNEHLGNEHLAYNPATTFSFF